MSVWTRIWPHVAAYLIMLVVSFMLFRPYVFEDKVLAQPDNQRAKAMQAEVAKFKERDGKFPLWTNAMFSGMPTYMIQSNHEGNLHIPIFHASLWGKEITQPHFVILLCMVMAYLAMVMLGIDWRLALLGGVSYGISNYFVDLAEAGHSTKMVALAFTPAIWAAGWMTLKGRWLLGAGLLGLFTSLQIISHHLQITYYTMLLLGIGTVIFGAQALRSNGTAGFLKGVGMMAIGVLLGIASNISTLWPNYEYSKETIRGGSELKAKATEGSGLSKEYAFDWSYGIDESMTLLIPNFMGGGASQTFKGTETYKRVFPTIMANLSEQGVPAPEAKKMAEQQVASLFYHGDQPFVGVAIYFGAALVLFFFLGALLTRGPLRWWMLAATVTALSFAWGKHFFLNGLLFDYFPFFNKFRAVSMALGISQLALIVLAMMGLQQFFRAEAPARRRALLTAGGIAGGLCLLGLAAGAGMSMSGANDERLGAELAGLLQQDRASLLRADALRSLVVAGLAFGLLWAWSSGMLKRSLALAGIALVSIGDVWMIDQRILFPEKFEPRTAAEAVPPPSEADQFIMGDPDIHFRVLDLRGNPFTNANTSLYHKSIGGYHAAKLSRYQDMIESYLSDPGKNMALLGILNTKYIIQRAGDKDQYFEVRENLGDAWFIQRVRGVADADTELANLKATTLRSEVVVQPQYMPDGWQNEYVLDTNAYVKLTGYHPDTMTYTYSNPNEGFLVFSEVYYPPSKGWKVYLDGKPYEDFTKVNYLLRGLRVPAGENHTLQMVFSPDSIKRGGNVSLAGTLLTILLVLGGLIHGFRTHGLPGSSTLGEDKPAEKATRKPSSKTKG